MRKQNNRLSKPAERLLFAVLVLTGIGIIMIYSASAIYSEKNYHDPAYFLKRQLLFAFVGVIIMLLALRIPPVWLKDHSRLLVFLSFLTLLLVFAPVLGKSGGGARRWIGFMGFYVQPAEFAKLAVCIYLSDYLSRKGKKIDEGSIQVFIPPLIVIGILCGLIIMQPDLGSVVFIFMLAVLLFFVAGMKMRFLLGAVAMGIPAVIFLIAVEPYRLRRIVAFLNPWEDPLGAGYQIIQSFLAFALGGTHGAGLGFSTQKLFYLPQSYTDFIFAIVGEELGLMGAGVILILFIGILSQGQNIARSLRDPFSSLFAYGLTLLISLQAVLNLMVATGLIPTKGLPLPFISYGGSSLVFNLAAVGLLLGLDYHKR